MTVLEAPSSAPLPPPARRRWPRVAAALLAPLLLVALTAAWLWVGTHPVLAQGSVHQPGAMRTANDGVTDTRYVAPPGGAEMTVSLRNDSRAAVRVSAPPLERTVPIVTMRGFQLLDPRNPSPDSTSPWSAAVVVPAGGEAALRLRVGTDGCMSYPAGGAAWADVLPLSVRSLGLRSVQELPLPLPVAVVGPVRPDPSCPDQ